MPLGRIRRVCVRACLALAMVSAAAGCSTQEDPVRLPDLPASSSIGEFCTHMESLVSARTGADLRAWAAQALEVGGPADMPAQARNGFSVLVALAGTLEADADASSIDDRALSEDQNSQLAAFSIYVAETCG